MQNSKIESISINTSNTPTKQQGALQSTRHMQNSKIASISINTSNTLTTKQRALQLKSYMQTVQQQAF